MDQSTSSVGERPIGIVPHHSIAKVLSTPQPRNEDLLLTKCPGEENLTIQVILEDAKTVLMGNFIEKVVRHAGHESDFLS